ncbi:MAG: hypothetical protein NC912_03575 [Candidatus Omnitrophica bacterium]|nr:hypothetical protein [Candidatus Omnitrophota bacterium]
MNRIFGVLTQGGCHKDLFYGTEPLLNKNGIYIARDRYGYMLLVIGKRNKDWAVTVETTAFLMDLYGFFSSS